MEKDVKTLKQRGKTMIQVNITTVKKLNKAKLVSREDYDSVINRLLEFHNKNVREVGG